MALAATAAGDDGAPPKGTPTAAPRLHPPLLRAEAIGPTLVRLTAETAPEDTPYVYGVRATCTTADGDSRRLSFPDAPYESAQWTGTGGVSAGSTVHCRVSAESGVSARRSDSDWSNEVSVQTPPPPEKPPAAPTDLSAKPAGPFRVELGWRDRSDDEYGFEIRKQVAGDWVRVRLVDPNVSRVTLHGRPPSTEARYRVRAFNVRGVSADSNDAAVRTDSLVDSPPRLPEPEPRPTRGPCSTREQVMRDLQADGAGETGGAVPDERLYESKLGGPWELVAFAYPPCAATPTAAGSSTATTTAASASSAPPAAAARSSSAAPRPACRC
ncbi:MAG: fibronectin type III domain-containing protein [Candidatus Binatia bacterium]